ncbi:alpha/beta-hydrolase [Cadophora sp. DSE1049]|nr:alpha/beta-hydrolase [Cadophora sp. DSE1049]
MTGYGDNGIWKDIQSFLPQRLHFTAEHHPEEDWWETQGHRIHLDRWRNPNAKIRLILFHGVGTNGRQMSMILGRPLHEAGFEAVAIDMPGYGETIVNRSSLIGYDDWVKIGSDFIDHELTNDPRPIALYGLSAGGMETYHVATLNKKVKGIIGMTFMDMRDWKIRDQVSRNIFMSRVGMPMAAFSDMFPIIRSVKMPMWLASKMHTLTNDQKLLEVMMNDPSSAGRWNSMHFIATHASYKPDQEPEEFTVCPILLTQPTEDTWTPQWVSEMLFAKIKKVETKITKLEGAGHYPVEDPGLQQMADAIIEFLNKIASTEGA